MTKLQEGAQEGDTKLRKKTFPDDFYVIDWNENLVYRMQWGLSRPLRQIKANESSPFFIFVVSRVHLP